MNYIPLRVKTSYSLLYSLLDIKKIVLYCKEKNIKSIAICDTSMYGVMEFYKECVNNGIKPIIGLEFNVNDKFVLLYAKNYKGYQNLCKLIFIKQNELITKDILNKYSDNLICVSNDDYSDIYNDYYYGYSDVKDRNDLKKSIYVNDIRCFNKDDIKYLKYLYMIKENKKIDDDFYYEEVINSYFDFNEIDYNNALEISNMCNITFEQNKNLMPKYDIDNSKEYLFNLAKKGLYKRLDGKVTKKYYDRLLYELDVIDKMGFNDYFLVVFDYVKYAKTHNILVGPGRGSAAGSLVSYSLGVTDIDPLRYNLLFERFLNPERVTMPDIDIDFEATRREEVVNYVIEKYGETKCVPIITFSTLTGKQVLRDVGRIFNIDISLIDKLTKYINASSLLKDELNNKDLYNFLNDNKELKNIYSIALKLEGLKRQISIHAAGVIISKESLDNYIPLEKYDDHYLSGYSMEHLEELGLIKMDILSLKNLTMIENILKDINKISFKDIPIDDNDSLKIFSDVTTCGIFQFESGGMKNFLRKLSPKTVDDIIAAIALFRPGPADNIDSYIRRKNGLEKIDYIDDSLIYILKPTYGIIIYQEQIMQIANVMAGYSYAKSDMLRRAMSKKKKDVLVSLESDFINSSVKRGYKKEIAEKTYKFILEFANYGFNKAHSVAYTIIVLKMAYLKVHYKEYFMASLLTNTIGNEVKTKEYIEECKKMGINILKPNINSSCYEYKKEDGGIRFSLASIRNVGAIASKDIIEERKKGLFIDYTDFVKRCYGKSVNKKALESLIDADAFSDFNYNHNTLYINNNIVINYATLAHDLDESLIDKPIINVVSEFDKDILIEKELNVFGFYLSNHPVAKYRLANNNTISTNEINKYFDKNINIIIIINKMNIIKTKKNEDMAFIDGYDEYGNIDVVVFPSSYDLIRNLNRKDIVLITGKVEKRMSNYQVVLSNIKKL